MNDNSRTGGSLPGRGSGRSEGPVEILRRWEDSGAIWRIVSRAPDELTVALLTCDAREEVGRLTSGDPELIAFVGDRPGSEA